MRLWRPGESPREAASEALAALWLGTVPPRRRRRRVCLRGHSLLCTQIVQRSLSGGFLVQDRALLAANARSMFDEAIDTTCFVGEGRTTAQDGSTYSQEKRPGASCELWSCGKVCLAVFLQSACRCWSWPPRATRTRTRARRTTVGQGYGRGKGI